MIRSTAIWKRTVAALRHVMAIGCLFLAPLATSSVGNAADEPGILASDVIVTPVLSLKGLPQKHVQLVKLLESLGGSGRTVEVRFSDRIQEIYPMTADAMSGPWLIVDRLPKKISTKASFESLRDPVILESLRKLHQRNVGIALRVSYIRDENNAALWSRSDDDFFKAIMPVAFPDGSKRALLEVSPHMTRDILVHEHEHLVHTDPKHPLAQLDERAKIVLAPKLLKVLRQATSEILSYRMQYEYLQGLPGGLNQGKRLEIVFSVRSYILNAMVQIKATDENRQILCEFKQLLRTNLLALPGNEDLQDDLSIYMGTCAQ